MIKCNGKDVIPRLNGKELSRVMYNGKQIYPTNNVIEVQLADVIAGDVCAFDGTNKRFFRFVNSGAKDDIKKYTPIGVVVVPASHKHYGDDKCAIMSLNYMNISTPTTGGDGQYGTTWGIPISIDRLSYFNVVPYIGGAGVVGDTILGTNSYGCYPSDKDTFTAVENPYDIKTKYYSSNDNYYTPSPYNNDGTFNPNYSLTVSPSSTTNALADFDGYNNTKKILAARGERDYSSWTPRLPEDFPPASCCDMYFTPGIAQGNWYLPSAGEIGYILARAQAIDDSLNKLMQIGIDKVYSLIFYLWSSTISHDSHAWIVSPTYSIQPHIKTDISGTARALAIV